MLEGVDEVLGGAAGLRRGGYVVREARTAADRAAAMALRAGVFPVDARGGDAHDALCRHVLVESEGVLACTFRILVLPPGGAERSYAALSYDLSRLAADPRGAVELGRFCIAPGRRDADVLRVAWGALARIVDRAGAGLLFGCASFPGCDVAAHADALGLLGARHVGPDALRPGPRAPERVTLGGAFDARSGLAGLPPLLRSYLGMGGWTSNHAVVDREMGTLHVFTALEIDAIPPARARALRAIMA